MRIAYVCADAGVPIFGRKGCSVHAREVLRALSAQGNRIELFAAHVGGDPPAELERLRIHPLPMPPKGDPAQRERAALAANHDLRLLLEKRGPFDLVYERYSLWSYAGMAYAQDIGKPGLLEVNAPLIEEQAQHRVLIDRRMAEQVGEWVFGTATVLLAVSEEVASYLNRYPGARGRVHVIPNGVDPDRFAPGSAPSRPGRPGVFTVGFVGTLKPWHGLLTLMQAFALLHGAAPDTRLLLVGDGPERARLEADVAARGLQDAVDFTGSVAPEEVPGLLASMDVAVAPYPPLTSFYFSPLKVYEYMAVGLPVVASRIGQLEQLIDDGVNGLLSPPGNAGMLAAALNRLRQAPALRARLGQAARITILREHTWEAVARRIIRIAEKASAFAAQPIRTPRMPGMPEETGR